MTPRRWQYVWGTLVILFLYVGVRPSETPPPAGHGDLVGHAMINLVLGLVAIKAFPARRAFVWALVSLVVVGGAIEVIQAFVPNREPSVSDFAFDIVGVAIAGLVGIAMNGNRSAGD